MSQFISSGNESKNIKTRHSFYETSPNGSVPSKSETFSRSDVNIVRINDFPSIIDSGCVNRYGFSAKETTSEEYYKNYEHDDVPVKDDSCCSSELRSDSAAMGDRKELTNSDLEKMEVRIYRNMSKELQTDESSTQDSLESNVKLFKATVQQIFDNFNSNMRDFELYREKFQHILSKNKENTVDEMEDFIKEMIKYIISSESSNLSNGTDQLTCSNISSEGTNEVDYSTFTSFTYDTGEQNYNTQKTVEAFKNKNYYTDSTVDEESSKINRNESTEKTFNIYLLNGDPCVEIKMNGRNLFSEINIRHTRVEVADQIASADNIKSVAAKKLQLQKYVTNQKVECQSNEQIIPVKISYAKKNIHSEDCPEEVDENSNKSCIFKICNYLCRKIRKNLFG